MEYLPQVKVTKEDFLALSDLAGEMSIMDYMSKVIHEHVAAQHSVQADGLTICQNCGSWLRAGECENCNSPTITSPPLTQPFGG